MLTEYNRLASHLIWLATHALDIGAMTVFLYTFREREAILDLFEAFCGARLTTTAFRIGGLREDLPPGFERMARTFQDRFLDCIDEYETLLTENRIWKKRTIGIGKLSAEDAIAMGVTGPVLRAAGVKYDIRKAFPYAAYA
jgi:NADH-quinone oxidoreductase subunit D